MFFNVNQWCGMTNSLFRHDDNGVKYYVEIYVDMFH